MGGAKTQVFQELPASQTPLTQRCTHAEACACGPSGETISWDKRYHVRAGSCCGTKSTLLLGDKEKLTPCLIQRPAATFLAQPSRATATTV